MTVHAVGLGPDDRQRKEFAWDVVKNSNDVVVSFAKLMTTTAFSAIGVLLALAELTGLANHSAVAKLGLATACGGLLLSSLTFAYAVRGQQIAVSPNDFEDVTGQFLTAARRRQRITTTGLMMLAVSTVVAIIVLIGAI